MAEVLTPKTVDSDNRLGLLELLVNRISQTAGQALHNQAFDSKLQALVVQVEEYRMYAQSLAEACGAVLDNHPHPDTDGPVSDLRDMAEAVAEATNRVDGYLQAIQVFGQDLQELRNRIQNQAVVLHQEL